MDEGLQFWCREGRLAILGSRQPVVMVQRRGEATAQQVPAEEMPAWPGGKDHNFVQAIQGRQHVQAPAECGLVAALFTDAVYRSAATGQAVPVPDLRQG